MGNTFNHQGVYVCECGKKFNNSQAFNGHKGHCKIHLGEEKYNKNHDLTLVKQEAMVKASSNKRTELSNIKKQAMVDEWRKSNPKCEKCGKLMTEYYGSGRFCSSVCAHSRKLTKSSREQIAHALNTIPHPHRMTTKIIIPKYCKLCGKELWQKNTSGYCRFCISKAPELHDKRVEASKKGAQHKIQNGTHVGWQSRNTTSYPEQFWMKVLDNNNISYQHNFPVKKADNINNYFLDFYIEVNDARIDLEIDGKQHGYKDRKESDKIRNEYLASQGYLIYRIKWNEINSDIGKELMQHKIQQFEQYYNGFR